MSRRHFDSTEDAELRAKIDQAKRLLPLPELMKRLGYGEHAKKSARCIWHEDKHPSFSVFRGDDGLWHWKCFAGCGEGDEISFLRKLKRLSQTDAVSLYLDMAGFPPHVPPKSHEYPEPRESHEFPQSPESRKSPGFPVYPVSKGQGLEKELKGLAARNACTERSTAKKGLWQLARDVRAVEKRIGRMLSNSELMLAFDEWHRLSQPFLDPQKTRADYLAAFLAKPAKVRMPTGEGDTLNKALEAVAKLSASELPVIPGLPDAPESLRRVAALHRELSRLCAGKAYFLTCRDTAKAHPGLSHQSAYNINLALAQLGVIQVVRAGDPRPNGKATEFRYLLSQSENGEAEVAATGPDRPGQGHPPGGAGDPHRAGPQRPCRNQARSYRAMWTRQTAILLAMMPYPMAGPVHHGLCQPGRRLPAMQVPCFARG
jgi:CHC2-type zinc finger protein